MGKKLYMLKLGGSIITDVTGRSSALKNEIRRVLREIEEARTSGDFDIIIGHGSGSFAHVPAKEYRVSEGLVNKDSRKGAAITQHVAQDLNRILIAEGLDMGMSLFQFAPASFLIAENGEVVGGMSDHIKSALESGFIPVVYGDVVIDRKKGVCIASTEKVMEAISGSIKVDKFIIATDVNGVFDKNPITDPSATLIERVDSSNIDAIVAGTGTNSNRVDVTGGMKTKLLSMHRMVKNSGAEGYIINGMVPGRLRDVLLGRSVVGTVVRP